MERTNPNDFLWHSMNAEEAVAALKTDAENGLSSEEAQKRLKEHGPNALPVPPGKNAFIRFLKHFNDILIYVLLAAALVTLFMGHYVDTAVILLVAVINACIGFVQENKAEKALEDIKNLLSLKAEVLRDSKRQEIEAENHHQKGDQYIENQLSNKFHGLPSCEGHIVELCTIYAQSSRQES